MADTIVMKGMKLCFMKNFTGKLNSDNIIQVHFLGNKYSARYFVHTQGYHPAELFLFCFTGILKKRKTSSAFLRISLGSSAAGPKIGPELRFQVSSEDSTPQPSSGPDLPNNALWVSSVQGGAAGSSVPSHQKPEHYTACGTPCVYRWPHSRLRGVLPGLKRAQ